MRTLAALVAEQACVYLGIWLGGLLCIAGGLLLPLLLEVLERLTCGSLNIHAETQILVGLFKSRLSLISKTVFCLRAAYVQRLLKL